MHAPQETLGVLLRRYRESAGLSQEELAERAGLSSHAVSALERGTRTRPYPHTVRSLADALGSTDDERARLVAAVPTRSRQPAYTTAPVDAAATRGHRSLPVPATPLHGREEDQARVAQMLREHRLVTLTGMGGVGKTRLALEAATRAAGAFADGVAYVELAPLRGTDAALSAVADALDAGPTPGSDVISSLLERLRDQHLLLVLDNLEHVLELAPSVAALVEGSPGLTVLTTSRAPLRVRGERELTVRPLLLPGRGEGDSPAVRLLLERAGAITPGWGTNPGDPALVEAICERLAGIPLALELAAGRARLLDPAALLTRLDAAELSGARDHPERQRTMRATLDWSYDLLGHDEQRLLRLLSVFAGGFRLDDLEGVAALAGGLVDTDVLSALEALAEHSLVSTDASEPAAGSRHRLLEPVAQYARSRLEEAGEAERVDAAHARHFLTLAEETFPQYLGAQQVLALARADLEHANLTAAIEHLLATGAADEAGRLCWALWLYWWLRGHLAHGRRLSEAALAHGPDAAVRSRAELAAATMCFAMDDVPAAREHWQAAVEHAGDDPVAMTSSVAGLGLCDLAGGDLETADAQFIASRPYAEAGGLEGEWTLALSWIWSGTVALLRGDSDTAVDNIQRGLASARRRGDRLTAYIALYNLFQVELSRGHVDAAHDHLEEGVALSLETGDHANLAYLLDAGALLAVATGTHSRVPLLLGASQTIRESIGAHGYGYYRPDPAAISGAADAAREHLGVDRFDDALDTGRGLSIHEAAAIVRRDGGRGGSAPRTPLAH